MYYMELLYGGLIGSAIILGATETDPYYPIPTPVSRTCVGSNAEIPTL
jgi:hypothetical protein